VQALGGAVGGAVKGAFGNVGKLVGNILKLKKKQASLPQLAEVNIYMPVAIVALMGILVARNYSNVRISRHSVCVRKEWCQFRWCPCTHLGTSAVQRRASRCHG
jgi:hypothetical protein